jgi:chromosome segregation ATPase/SAM-dependent methyltransferase
MTMDAQPRGGTHPSIVLSVHIEPLIRGRRVVILGDATIDLAERLGNQGARLVHAYDPDPARAAEALARNAGRRTSQGSHVTYAALEGDLGVRDGAFDIAVIPDLSLFVDPADLLRRARRLVPSGGVVVVASPNPEAGARLLPAGASSPSLGAANAPPPSYYELYDLISLQFSVVRMLGQAPFVGYTVADFAPEGEPGIAVDTSLLEATEQPEWFIAIGSERAIDLEAYAVVQIPLDAIALPSSGVRDSAGYVEDRLALTEAQARLALVTAELEELRARHRSELRDADARAQATSAMSARIVELETELAARDARLKETQGRAGDAHVRAERLTHQIVDMDEEIRRQRDRATKLTKQLDDEKKARTKADMELAMIRNRPELAGAKDRIQEISTDLEAARARIAELESQHAALSAQRAPSAPAPPSAQAPDPAITARLTELEAALAGARSALAEITHERDHARRRADAIEPLEAALARERAAAAEQRAELEKRCVALETRASILEERCTFLEERGAKLQARAAELEQREAELRSRAAEIDAQREEMGAALAGDLSAVEALLRERGRLIASLERDLRESESIGRELVEEIEALRAAAASSSASSGDPADGAMVEELSLRLDALAARSAKCEADYQAATWRVAQLERELAEARAGSPAAAETHRELERALSAAREEIETIRHALELSERLESNLARAAAEQSVLLHQTAGAAGQGS